METGVIKTLFIQDILVEDGVRQKAEHISQQIMLRTLQFFHYVKLEY